MLPPSGPLTSSTEFIHRPILSDNSSNQPSTVGRSRSFYNHQIEQLDKSHTHRTYDHHQPPSSSFNDRYSSLPKGSYNNGDSNYRVSSPLVTSSSGGDNWNTSSSRLHHLSTKDHRRYHDSHRTTGITGRLPYGGQSSRTTDFPDFAPLSSPFEIKSLTAGR